MGILRALLGLPPTYSQRARRNQNSFRVRVKNSFSPRRVGTCFGCRGTGRCTLKRCNGSGWYRF